MARQKVFKPINKENLFDGELNLKTNPFSELGLAGSVKKLKEIFDDPKVSYLEKHFRLEQLEFCHGAYSEFCIKFQITPERYLASLLPNPFTDIPTERVPRVLKQVLDHPEITKLDKRYAIHQAGIHDQVVQAEIHTKFETKFGSTPADYLERREGQMNGK